MTFLPQEFIRKVRDRAPLDTADVARFVQGVTAGDVTEGQIAAFAMAVYFNELPLSARIALTLAQRDSGDVLDWRGARLNGPVVDKHSTGGVGDLTSLVIGPMVAACGGYVPMISGRGLGHTGGTLDKLEAIPGYDVAPSVDMLRRVVRDTGLAIVGQTAQLAPADKRIYAVRDVTATVESISLITASILSKKLAAGVGALAMDVKVGSGAFMPSAEQSAELARSIVDVGNGAGMRTAATLTDMNQALAPCAGNAIEVRCAIDFLTGAARPARLEAVSFALAAQMLTMGGLAADAHDARRRLRAVLESGAAAERFARMVAALGGPADLVERPERHLPRAAAAPVAAARAGWIERIDARALGLAVVGLGGGRAKIGDTLDYSVGLSALAELGERVEAGQPLATVHARDADSAAQATDAVRRAYRIGAEPPAQTRVVHAVIE
ncbi:thymidine phosphorylase [Burkholderia pseudomallei]|uniref:thymidine phosphorylase n=1 Tax=Burkholderia pseudomallei TaxID=28450 RepID=UPI00006740F1|nr:thymidine phosphorylase [Burkholderia pseudomallei]AIP69390.1 thymidine phosphorylase [Burkholderia pseudomallei]AJW89064.1 thymidine phosphorylase [Burkholderia pseudomallei 406e]AYX30854.1 thymidine phosphorylase [Burkholderia pseudomallei]CAJ2972249.1 thymidine phosphorylase [Burkholderia pseudomallei]CAJ3049165.1 thymidine phosphorylase [Burkholderia pseudomallei]